MRALLWLSIGLAAALGACSQSLSGNLTGTGGAGAVAGTGTVERDAGGKVGTGAGGTVGYNPRGLPGAVGRVRRGHDGGAELHGRLHDPVHRAREQQPVRVRQLPGVRDRRLQAERDRADVAGRELQPADPVPPCDQRRVPDSGVPDICVADPTATASAPMAPERAAPAEQPAGGPARGARAVDGGEPDVCGAYAMKYATVLDAVKSCTFGAAGQCAQSVHAVAVAFARPAATST